MILSVCTSDWSFKYDYQQNGFYLIWEISDDLQNRARLTQVSIYNCIYKINLEMLEQHIRTLYQNQTKNYWNSNVWYWAVANMFLYTAWHHAKMSTCKAMFHWFNFTEHLGFAGLWWPQDNHYGTTYRFSCLSTFQNFHGGDYECSKI